MLLPIVVVLGVFSRLQIAVAEAYCDPPNNPKNGKVTYTSLESGSELTLECNDGYYLQDTEPVYCKLDGQWSKTNVECFAKTCDHPDHPEHGQVTFTSLTFGSQLKFKCDAGYLLEPDESVYCTSDGTWSRTDVRCVAETCGLPEHPENGQVIFTSLNFGSQLKFKCDEGYRLQAEGPVYCTSDGTWNSTDVQCIDALNVDRKDSDDAQFEEKDRVATAEQPFEDVTDGFVEWNQTDANIDNDSASSKYPDDDTMNHKTTENIVKEEKNEDDTACEPPPKIEGTLPVELNDPRPAVGTVVVYRCNFGYVNQDSKGFRSVCKLNEHSGRANWTNPNVACIPRSCGDPGFVLNAQRIGNLFTFPNNVEFQCEEGFKLKGSPIRYCQASGTWSGRLPTCEQIKCARPANPDHGRVRYASLDYGAELRYECDKGYVLGQHKQRTCTEDGTWSNNDPVCIEGVCEMPMSPEHGTVQLVGEPKVGSIAMYSCDEGRVLIGVVASKCLITGQWTFPPPKCLGSCVVSAISNGGLGHKETRRISRYRTEEKFVEFKVGTVIKHGETAIFRCKDGFASAGSLQSNIGSRLREEVVTCEDGQWSQPLECKAESCLGDPLHMDNGYPVVNNRSHGYTIYYRCNKYYVKAAAGEVKCMFGKWTGYTPICTDGRCYTNQLHNTGIKISNVQFIEHGKRIPVSCKEGYRPLNNWIQISCDTGKWNVSNNACVIEKCSTEPPEIHHGRYHYTNLDHNSEVKYECDPGYEMKEYSPVKCLYGQWSGQPPDCVEAVKSFAFNSATSASPNTDEKLPEQSENCFCTYKPGNTFLVATVNGKALKYDEPIRKGDTALLGCSDNTRHLLWQNGMRNYFVNMTCDECQVWTPGNLPSCETTFAGDSFIALDETLTVQPGGDVECQRDKRLRIACFSFNINYPEWRALDTQKEFAVSYYSTTYVDQTTRFISFLDLPQFRRKDEGIYECSTKDNYNIWYRSTKLKLTLTGLTCPRILITEGITVEYTNERRVGSTATFSCSAPFVLVGHSTLQCLQSGKWNKPQPGCRIPQKRTSVGLLENTTPRSHTPKEPESEEENCFCTYKGNWQLTVQINGGRIWYGEQIQKGETAAISCTEEKMQLVLPNGSASISETMILTCHTCRTWNARNLPSCRTVESLATACPQLLVTEGMNVQFTKGKRVGSKATFSCTHPLLLLGQSTLHCLQGGQWSHLQPTCERPEVFCPQIHETDIFAVHFDNGRKVNSNAFFSCKHPNLKIAGGVNTRTCLQTGEWSGANPECIAFGCLIGDFTGPENVLPNVENVTEELQPIGSELPMMCEDGLVLIGDKKAKCGTQGKWNYGKPKCVLGCHLNIKDVNPQLIFRPVNEYYRFGEFITLSCAENLELTSDVERVMCMNDGWSHPIPECREKKTEE